MENFAALVPLVIIFPLLGVLINLFLGKYLSERMVGGIASTMAGLAFVVALTMTLAMPGNDYTPVVVNTFLPSFINIPSAGLDIPFQLRVDTLSLTMMLVVTGIGTLIHIYAIGYMHGDSRFNRFFVYLNLFLAFMLVLVTGNNLLLLFIGWEGVGLCSFLLIGFWFDKTKGEGWRNSNAARKAFIVNRVGDFGLMLAIFFAFWTFGTLDFYKPGEAVAHGLALSKDAAHSTDAAHSEEAAHGDDSHGGAELATSEKGMFGQTLDYLERGGHQVYIGTTAVPFETILTLITLFMIVGVTGKSAQIPLFIWLPDAMAGPTPVSALIHAATMVTAGIYLVTRHNVFFWNAPVSSAILTLIGSATALMAGFIALGQWDIKKVLAYSTVSQLGFMVAAIGVGAYAAGMFHLITHAFFKALLFLGSGSVIHAMEHGHHHAHAHAHGDGHGETASDADHGEAKHAEHADAETEEHAFDPQDMRNMGGLWKRMPLTFWTYLIGTLALAGIFPLSGFWSKDEILVKTFNAGLEKGRADGYIALVVLLIAAGFTAFYMWRQIRMVFLGEARTDAARNAPESVALMTVPLLILAVLSVIGGLLNIPLGINLPGLPIEVLVLWLEESVSYAAGATFNPILAIIALLVAVVAILLANSIYAVPLTKKGKDKLEARKDTRAMWRLANSKLMWDENVARFIEAPFNRASDWLANKLDWEFWHNRFHEGVIRNGFQRLSQFLAYPVDRGAIDAGFMRIPQGILNLGRSLRGLQTGYVRTYVFTMLVGVLLIIVLILLPIFR